MSIDWEMFKGECPECGKEVYVTTPERSQFCSKACETNSSYRNVRFKGTEREKWVTPDEATKFKFK
jgi:hypothetical protein